MAKKPSPDKVARELIELDEKAQSGDQASARKLCREGLDLINSSDEFRAPVLEQLEALNDQPLVARLTQGQVCQDGSILFDSVPKLGAELNQTSSQETFGKIMGAKILSMNAPAATLYFTQAAREFRKRFFDEDAFTLGDALVHAFRSSSTGARFDCSVDSQGRITLRQDTKALATVNFGDLDITKEARTSGEFAQAMTENIGRMEPNDASNYTKVVMRNFRDRFSKGDVFALKRLLNESLHDSNHDGRHFWAASDGDGGIELYPVIARTPAELGHAIAQNIAKMPPDVAPGYFVEVARQFRASFPDEDAKTLAKIVNENLPSKNSRKYLAIATEDGKVSLNIPNKMLSEVNLGKTIGAQDAQPTGDFTRALAEEVVKMSPEDASSYFEGMARKFREHFPGQDSFALAKLLSRNWHISKENYTDYQCSASSDGSVVLKVNDRSLSTVNIGDALLTDAANSPSEFAKAMVRNILRMNTEEATSYFKGTIQLFHKRFPEQNVKVIQQAIDNILEQYNKSPSALSVISDDAGQLVLQTRDGEHVYAKVDLAKAN